MTQRWSVVGRKHVDDAEFAAEMVDGQYFVFCCKIFEHFSLPVCSFDVHSLTRNPHALKRQGQRH